MSEELLSNDMLAKKIFDPAVIRTTAQMHWPLGYLTLNFAMLQPTLY